MYLILMTDPEDTSKRPEIRAVARRLLSKRYHFEIQGHVKIGKHRVRVQGQFGNNGKPIPSPSREVWERAVPVPDKLQDLIWDGVQEDDYTEAYYFQQFFERHQSQLREWIRTNNKEGNDDGICGRPKRRSRRDRIL